MTYLAGSGVPVKKWQHGWFGSCGRMETMLPVVINPPCMLIPLGLSDRISIMVSAVMFPKRRNKRFVLLRKSVNLQ